MNRRRRLLSCVLAALVLYLGIYVLLSLNGRYEWNQSGRLRYSGGLSMAITDEVRWQPALLLWEPYRSIDGSKKIRANLGGWIFAPLILLDQRWWHASRVLFEALQPRASRV